MKSFLFIFYNFKVYKKKFFIRQKKQKINLFSLPCRYLRIEVSKGWFEINKIKFYGFNPENAEEIFGEDAFKITVANPQKLLYDI